MRNILQLQTAVPKMNEEYRFQVTQNIEAELTRKLSQNLAGL